MSQFKRCPRCQQPAALDALVCQGCGRQFRTQFVPPADQTQMFTAPPAAPPTYAPQVATGSPIDTTERSVSMVWTAVGLVMSGLLLLHGIRSAITLLGDPAIREVVSNPAVQPWTLFGFAWLLLLGFAFSFLVMRMRRLYLATPDGQPHWDLAARRGRYAVGSSISVGLLVLSGVAWGVHDYQQAERNRQPTPLAIPAATPDRTPAPTFDPPAPAYSLPDPPATSGYVPYVPARPRRPRPTMAPVPTQSFGDGGMGGGMGGAVASPSDPNIMPCGHKFAGFPNASNTGAPTGVCELGHRATLVNGRWRSGSGGRGF